MDLLDGDNPWVKLVKHSDGTVDVYVKPCFEEWNDNKSRSVPFEELAAWVERNK